MEMLESTMEQKRGAAEAVKALLSAGITEPAFVVDAFDDFNNWTNSYLLCKNDVDDEIIKTLERRAGIITVKYWHYSKKLGAARLEDGKIQLVGRPWNPCGLADWSLREIMRPNSFYELTKLGFECRNNMVYAGALPVALELGEKVNVQRHDLALLHKALSDRQIRTVCEVLEFANSVQCNGVRIDSNLHVSEVESRARGRPNRPKPEVRTR